MTEPGTQPRAAAYLRESTEDQADGYSLDAQRQGIHRLASEQGYALVDEYVDLHSGWRNSEKRPEFQRLMADAAAGRLEAVIVFHSSRFARNQTLARRYKSLLREHGVQLLSASQPKARAPQTAIRSPRTRSEMLLNSAYAGYVSARRDKAFGIKGQHPAIVDQALFERVQETRASRVRTLNPGRPSGGYALAKLARCERCGRPLHGTTGGRNNKRRYYCSGRKQGSDCDQPIADADAFEDQLGEYVRCFNPRQPSARPSSVA